MRFTVICFSLLLFGVFIISCGGQNKKAENVPVLTNDTLPVIKSDSSKNSFSLGNHLSYKIISERKSKSLKNDSVKQIIKTWIKENENPDIETLSDFILTLTKDQLTFSTGKCSSVPDQLIKEKKANCVGYAAYFNALMNFSLEESGLNKKYKCAHCVAKIYFDDQNLNALFNDPFFKDHDFNVLTNLSDQSQISIDPSLYEYMGIKRVSLKK